MFSVGLVYAQYIIYMLFVWDANSDWEVGWLFSIVQREEKLMNTGPKSDAVACSTLVNIKRQWIQTEYFEYK